MVPSFGGAVHSFCYTYFECKQTIEYELRNTQSQCESFMPVNIKSCFLRKVTFTLRFAEGLIALSQVGETWVVWRCMTFCQHRVQRGNQFWGGTMRTDPGFDQGSQTYPSPLQICPSFIIFWQQSWGKMPSCRNRFWLSAACISYMYGPTSFEWSEEDRHWDSRQAHAKVFMKQCVFKLDTMFVDTCMVKCSLFRSYRDVLVVAVSRMWSNSRVCCVHIDSSSRAVETFCVFLRLDFRLLTDTGGNALFKPEKGKKSKLDWTSLNCCSTKEQGRKHSTA